MLITGITGFVGSHLCDYLLQNHPDVKVFGLVRWRSPKDNILHVLDKITLIEGDLTDLPSLVNCLQISKPDFVFHLAAQSYVPYSFTAPVATLQANCIGTCNLLEAIKTLKLQKQIDPVVHICSSSEVYGQVTEADIPIKETCPLRPASPYAVSKVCEDMLGLQYWLSWGIKTIRTRMFTHEGFRRSEVFVTSNFAKQIAEIQLGIRQEKVIYVGNLNSVRTFADVKDTVRAYWLLVNKCQPGEVYNIGGTETMTVEEMLNRMIKQSEVTDIQIKIDPARLRPSDVTLQIPDCSKFRAETGWKSNIPYDQTIKDSLDYWNAHLKMQSKMKENNILESQWTKHE